MCVFMSVVCVVEWLQVIAQFENDSQHCRKPLDHPLLLEVSNSTNNVFVHAMQTVFVEMLNDSEAVAGPHTMC